MNKVPKYQDLTAANMSIPRSTAQAQGAGATVKILAPKSILLVSLLVALLGGGWQARKLMAAPISPWRQKQCDLELLGIRIFRQDRRIEINGRINCDRGLIELLATAPGGKEHESLLVLPCNPCLLKTALILIGLQEGGGPRYQGDPTPPYGDRVTIYVQWNVNGQQRRYRAEDLIWDNKHQRTMPHVGWVFTGSRFVKRPGGRGEIFMANVTGILIVTFNDPDALLNNPLPEGADDTVYFVNTKLVPAAGTPVKVIIVAQP